MLTWPKLGLRVLDFGIALASASALCGGTMRSRAGITCRLGMVQRESFTGLPATFHVPRAVWFSAYHAVRHSRARFFGNGTPSLTQSSNRTNDFASLLLGG